MRETCCREFASASDRTSNEKPALRAPSGLSGRARHAAHDGQPSRMAEAEYKEL